MTIVEKCEILRINVKIMKKAGMHTTQKLPSKKLYTYKLV